MVSFKGNWDINVKYNKGDTIINKNSIEYICNISHVSDNLVGPWCDEEIHWTKKSKIKYTSSPDSYSVNEKYNKKSENKKYESCVLNTNSDENYEKFELKRKIRRVERELDNFNKKRKMEGSIKLTLEEQILLLDVDLATKSFLVEKYESLQHSKDSEYNKGITWLKIVVNLPFNTFKPFNITKNCTTDKIINFFDKVKSKLDSEIYGLDDTKEEILEFLARKIVCPDSKGHILALQGSMGVGKTKLLQTLAKALDLPFHQINLGGMNDGSILTGHSETYVGSKPGKIIEILIKSKCMNSIIYFDEFDKISEHKGKEINGILTHILDEQQNNKYQDNYLSNINIDLSKVFFVIAFNDINKINPIVLDRMKIIKIKNPSIEDKIIIAKDKLVPNILKEFNFDCHLSKELLIYIINEKIPKEDGVRKMKQALEKIFNKINYLLLVGKKVELNKEFIDNTLITKESNDYQMMYI